ncbi:MAG: ABC transporter permease [Caldilineales bacterium]|nr:ABC transporter permease [Caldilineales bacterium]MDW8317256.1 ABC transporter permease [Anaerolineae bacterium]
MSLRRVRKLAWRVMRQVLRDRRTVALIIFAPILVLTLGAILFRAEPAPVSVGVVNEDEGAYSPLGGSINLGQRMLDELTAGDAFRLVILSRSEVDDRLRSGDVKAVIVFPEDFTASFLKSHQVVLDLRLEGSEPTRSKAIIAYVSQAAMKTMARMVGTYLGLSGSSPQGGGEGEVVLPVSAQVTYLYGGEQFDTFDYIAPVYIALLGMFFVFLLACIAFLRERSQGTIERLAATPASRFEIVLGYMFGLGLFGLIQVTIILFFTVWVIGIHYKGSLALMLLVVAIMAVVGINLGILASAFARTEFQVIQFIPLVLLPQALLGGTFWSISDMPTYLQPIAYAMPIYYANVALRDVMLKGWGLGEIWPNLAVLAGIGLVLVILSSLMMRREVA